MQDRPDAHELLETLAELLDDEVKGEVRGLLQHKVRVAANLCRILARESQLAPGQDAREVELLAGLTGAQGTSEELSKLLCDQLDGSDPELEAAAIPALLEIVRGKLAVAKPGHDAYTFEAELGEDDA